MKIEIPLIFWHGNRDRIMSIDFYPNSNHLVTCGAEAEDKMWIKLWEIEDETTSSNNPSNPNNDLPSTEVNPFKTNKQNPFLDKDKDCSMTIDEPIINQAKIKPRFLYDISGAHTASVNVVRFSPNGMYMASGGDDSAIVIWVQKSRPVEFGSLLEKVTWSNHKILRGHLSDIYDLSWSPDSKFIISGSVDNSAIIFNIEKGKGIQKMSDHSHFVQGVSWDPRNKFVTTQSSDKSVRIYKNADMKQEVKFYFSNQLKRFNKESNIANATTNVSPPVKENYSDDKMMVDKEPVTIMMKKEKEKKDASNYQYYFADEVQCHSFVRRHNWSPDGSILLLVSGMNKSENLENENVVWGLSRKDMTKPCFMLPTLDKSATCVRFCPIIFEKDPPEKKLNSNPELIDLPYKMVFAIGTLDSLFIYDTQDICPKFVITNIHYQPITDLAWKGSSILAASSSDGYITFCAFDKEELGRPADVSALPEKSKELYNHYVNIDAIKNVIPIHNVTNIVKVKKKPLKVENPTVVSENASNENSITPGIHNSNSENYTIGRNVDENIQNVDANANMSNNNIITDNQIIFINNIQNEQIDISNTAQTKQTGQINNTPLIVQPGQDQQSGQKRRIAPTFIK